jgi:hypothetical protein
MCGRVAIRRIVATADVTAFEADPEVQPFRSDRQAVLATLDGLGEFGDVNAIEMGAGSH